MSTTSTARRAARHSARPATRRYGARAARRCLSKLASSGADLRGRAPLGALTPVCPMTLGCDFRGSAEGRATAFHASPIARTTVAETTR